MERGINTFLCFHTGEPLIITINVIGGSAVGHFPATFLDLEGEWECLGGEGGGGELLQ